MECGIINKQSETGVRQAYELMVTDKEYITLKEDPTYMELDEIKVAFGPYITGFVLAIIAFYGEYYFRDNNGLKLKLFRIKKIFIKKSLNLNRNQAMILRRHKLFDIKAQRNVINNTFYIQNYNYYKM